MKKIILLIFFSLLLPTHTEASLGCMDYGMAYETYGGYCECMSGYVMSTNLFGKPYCVSGDMYCNNKYGYGSEYDYLTDSCKCSSGYVWDINYGSKTCVSCSTKYGYGATSDWGGGCKCKSGYAWGKNMFGEDNCIDANDICKDKYGYNSKYNSLSDKCECKSGYELSLKTIGSGLECKSCTSKYGYHSSFNYLSEKCECDSGYTLNDNNQCVEKQNNVYFILKEVNTDDKQAIIKSTYDYKYYLVIYGTGCYSSSINRYLHNNLVVNLGTDFDVDIWDTIVLQDDNEVCDIRNVKKVDSNFTLETEETTIYYFNTPQAQDNISQPNPPAQNIEKTDIETSQTTKTNNKEVDKTNETVKPISPKEIKCNDGLALSLDKKYCVKIPTNAHPVDNKTDVWLCNNGYKEINNSCVKEITDSSTSTNSIQKNDKVEQINDNIQATSAATLTKIINFFKKLKFW